MTLAVELLNDSVVGVLMAEKESAPDGAAVGVGAVGKENRGVELVVEQVHSAVQGYHYHLGCLQQSINMIRQRILISKT